MALQPQISVIIPFYNSNQTVVAAVNSVINQRFSGVVEIICVNDGSKDNSAELIEALPSTENRNIIVLNKPNGGVSSARNAGLKIAKGDFIALLDSDDEWHEDKLVEQMMVFAQYPQIDFVGCSRNNEGITFPYKINETGLVKVTTKKLLLQVKPQTSTAVFKRKILDNTGYYDEEQKYAEDANYWLKISTKNNMCFIPKSMVTTGGGKRNFGEKGLSSNLIEMEKGELKNIRETLLMRRINVFEFVFFWSLSVAKFARRYFIVKFG